MGCTASACMAIRVNAGPALAALTNVANVFGRRPHPAIGTQMAIATIARWPHFADDAGFAITQERSRAYDSTTGSSNQFLSAHAWVYQLAA